MVYLFSHSFNHSLSTVYHHSMSFIFPKLPCMVVPKLNCLAVKPAGETHIPVISNKATATSTHLGLLYNIYIPCKTGDEFSGGCIPIVIQPWKIVHASQ